MQGIFITVEGVDGAGKSTAMEWLVQEIAKQRSLVHSREPGGTSLGEALRTLLLHESMNVETETLLMFAARREHLAQVILPALSRGEVVVSDRFSDASFAYQSGGRGVDWDKMAALEQWVQQGLQPDLTLLFDVPLEIARERITARAAQTGEVLDKFENESMAFFERVRAAYLRRAAAAPERIVVINSTLPLAQVKQHIAAAVQARLPIQLHAPPLGGNAMSYFAQPLPWHQTDFSTWWSRMRSERAAHAYLVVVPEDTGGEQLLHAMGSALLCETTDEQHRACGVCASCQLIQAWAHPDLTVLRPSIWDTAHPIEEMRPEKPSKEITIEHIRALDNSINQTSHRGGMRVVLIYPAAKLNRNAANALLKTLEEPPAQTVFLLLAQDVQEVLPTINSRCQRIDIGPPDTATALAYLETQQGKTSASDYLRQESGAVMRVAKLMSTDYFTWQTQWIAGLAQGARLDALTLAATADKWLAEATKNRLAGGFDGERVLDMRGLMTWLQRWIHDLTRTAQGGAAQYYPDQQARLTDLAQQANLYGLHQLDTQLLREKRIADHPLNTRSWIEWLLLHYIRLMTR